jgi:hypothetical protein
VFYIQRKHISKTKGEDRYPVKCEAENTSVPDGNLNLHKEYVSKYKIFLLNFKISIKYYA